MKQNDPLSAYALHILNNNHEYGLINITMTVLQQITQTSVLIAYEHFLSNNSITTLNSYGNKTQMKTTRCSS